MNGRRTKNSLDFMKQFLLFFLFFKTFVAYSQTISGVIKDKDSFVENASVSIENPNNGEIIAYTYTDSTGNYSLKPPKSGIYKLTINTLGYLNVEDTIEISFQNIQKNYTLQKDNTKEIKEVILTNSKPITLKKDTIEFNVKSFLQGNERVVEDLLKKIPGLNIESDGTIKVGNQEVEKVMIENDDFFEKGYKITTKNMPVKPLDKIQIIENYSNNKLLKNIEKSNKVALNLTLKEGEKSKWFGSLSLASSIYPEKRYNTKTNLMNFGKKNKYFILINANNIGQDPTGGIENLTQSSATNEIGLIGDKIGLNNVLDYSASIPGISQNKTNFNNDKVISLNSIHNPAKKIKIKLVSFFNHRKNNFYREVFTEYKLSDQNFTNFESFDLNKTTKNIFFKTEAIYDINNISTLEFSGNINENIKNNSGNSFLNRINYLENTNSNNIIINQRLKHSIKLNDSTVIVSSINYIKEKLPINYSSNQYFFSELFPNNYKVNEFGQDLINKLEYLGIKSHYLKNYKDGKLLEISISSQMKNEHFINTLYLKEDQNIIYKPIDYNNNLNFKFYDTELMVKYLFKFKKIEITPKISNHLLFNKLNNTTENSKSYFYINTDLGFKWQISYNQKIISLFQYSKSNLETFDLLPNYFFTGMRSFEKGLENQQLLANKSASFIYSYGNWSDKFFANFVMNLTNYDDYIVSQNIINQEYSLNSKIIMNNKRDFATKLNIDFYISTIKSNLKLSSRYFYSNYYSSANNLNLIKIQVNNYNLGFDLRSVWRKFNYHIGSKWNVSQIKSSVHSTIKNNVSFIDFNYNINKKINLQLKGEKYYFSNISNSNNHYYFADFFAIYNYNQKINFTFQFNNIFNTNYFLDYTISDFFISETKYRLLPRFISLGVEFSF